MPNKMTYASRLLVVLVTLTLSAGAAEAQTTAAGPYYATPSWDQTFACAAPATCPRFIVLSNFGGQAVLDRETGLVWERHPNPNTQVNWHIAVLQCVTRVVGNRAGWRAPSIQELLTLIDPDVTVGLSLPAGHPFSNVQERYWSGTISGYGGDLAWVAGFEFNPLFGISAVQFSTNTNTFPVWCVRGGQSADVQ